MKCELCFQILVQAMFYFCDLSYIKLYWAIYEGNLLYQIQDRYLASIH